MRCFERLNGITCTMPRGSFDRTESLNHLDCRGLRLRQMFRRASLIPRSQSNRTFQWWPSFSNPKIASTLPPDHHRRDAPTDMGAVWRASVSLIMWTGGAYLPFLHERHFNAASSFQIGVSRGRRTASSGMLASVSQRWHLTCSQP
jgi:hypothetical protein